MGARLKGPVCPAKTFCVPLAGRTHHSFCPLPVKGFRVYSVLVMVHGGMLLPTFAL